MDQEKMQALRHLSLQKGFPWAILWVFCSLHFYFTLPFSALPLP